MKNNTLIIIAITTAFVLAPQMVSQAKSAKTKPTNYSAASIAKGRDLFKELKCSGCHAVDDKGGCLAPELNGVTERHDEAYLMLRLSNAKGDEDRFIKRIGHPELVPHPRFPKSQVKYLLAYLSTFKSDKK